MLLTATYVDMFISLTCCNVCPNVFNNDQDGDIGNHMIPMVFMRCRARSPIRLAVTNRMGLVRTQDQYDDLRAG